MPQHEISQNDTEIDVGDEVLVEYFTRYGNEATLKGEVVDSRTVAGKRVWTLRQWRHGKENRLVQVSRYNKYIYTSVEGSELCGNEAYQQVESGRKTGEFIAIRSLESGEIAMGESGHLSSMLSASIGVIENRADSEYMRPVRIRFEQWGDVDVGTDIEGLPHEREIDVVPTNSKYVINTHKGEGNLLRHDNRPTIEFEGPEGEELILTHGRHYVDRSLDLPKELAEESTLKEYPSVLGLKVENGYKPIGVNVALYVPSTEKQ